MVTLEAALLAVMLRQPGPADGGETPAEREVRLRAIAAAIAQVASQPPDGWMAGSWELAAMLAATTYEEGQYWHVEVHNGKRRGDHGRAACLAQVHAHPSWFPKAEWQASMGVGLEPTVICMTGASRVLAHYSRRCTQPWMSVEVRLSRIAAGYGSGISCNAAERPWAQARARRAARWLAEMDAMREEAA